jgi:hypothetical protein
MKTSMIAREAQTFVALGRAVSLAAGEGALHKTESADLSAALVVALITGGMELETYARLHDALARLLEKAFETPARGVTSTANVSARSSEAEEPLGVYLEVVGDAWEKVSWEGEPSGRIARFVRRSFDLDRARFGEGCWFRAPLKASAEEVLRAAKAAGLLVISVEGALPKSPGEACMAAPDSRPTRPRVTLGWGDRRTVLELGEGS